MSQQRPEIDPNRGQNESESNSWGDGGVVLPRSSAENDEFTTENDEFATENDGFRTAILYFSKNRTEKLRCCPSTVAVEVTVRVAVTSLCSSVS